MSLILISAWEMYYAFEGDITIEECLNAARKAWRTLY